MFTEEEKNDLIGYCSERMGMISCPFPDYSIYLCDRENCPCYLLYPSMKMNPFGKCPCGLLTEKYVKDKFWKAME